MMIEINPKENTELENQKILAGSILPRPIALVTTLSKEGVLNAAPFSYFNIVAPEPPIVSISVQTKDGKLKDTARNIFEQEEFVVHIVDDQNLEQSNATAATLPPDVSEVEQVNFTPIESTSVKVPGIKESKVRMECKLLQTIPFGDKKGHLILGEVTRFHIDESIYEEGKIDFLKLNPMSRLAGADYAAIGDIVTIPYPK